MRLVVNKIDLPPAWDLAQMRDLVKVSAHTGAGIPDLLNQIAKWLVPAAPPPQTAVPYAPDVADAIESAWQAVQEGETGAVISLLEPFLAPFPWKELPVG
jgi:hypothetical protein